MRAILLMLLAVLVFTGCSTEYYIVRHAEKAATPASDPLLSPEGIQRAAALRTLLKKKSIKQIFSTPTQRTMLTARPISEALGIPVQSYGPVPDATFIQKIKADKKNTLIVGHSNTVDDLVNGLIGANALQDLPESVYSKMYVVKQRGKQLSWRVVEY